jgi:hypothetical protein
MLQFGGLRYYSVPALQSEYVVPQSLTIELGIFAGRLYLQFEECAPLVKYIDSVSINGRSNTTATETIAFILEWLSLRRRGQDIMHTPLGYVCQGRPLGIEHAFFMTNRAGDNSVAESYHTSEGVNAAQEDEDDDDEKWYDVQESLAYTESS